MLDELTEEELNELNDAFDPEVSIFSIAFSKKHL